MSLPAQPATIAPCPKCGGRRVGANVGEAQVRTKFFNVSGFEAVVCSACGYSELYVQDMNNMRKALQKHPKDFRY